VVEHLLPNPGNYAKIPQTLSNLPTNPYQSFIESRKAKGVSPKSIYFYHRCLSKALEYIGNPYHAKPEDIIAFLNTIPPNEIGLSNRHAYRRALMTFYSWLEKVYDLPNPVKKVDAPPLPNVIMPTLRLHQIKEIIKTQSAKGKAIVMLATASGLRRSELANVEIENIDWQGDRIRTLGKGRKEAYAPIGFSAPYIKQWLTESGKTSGNLFDLTSNGMRSFFLRLQNQTGLKTNAHVFRRAFAVVGRELGLDCLTIKDLGRWSSVDMVERYTKDFNFNDANKLYKEKLSKLDFTSE
jgi:site-specific recombinase XerD